MKESLSQGWHAEDRGLLPVGDPKRVWAVTARGEAVCLKAANMGGQFRPVRLRDGDAAPTYRPHPHNCVDVGIGWAHPRGLCVMVPNTK